MKTLEEKKLEYNSLIKELEITNIRFSIAPDKDDIAVESILDDAIEMLKAERDGKTELIFKV